MAKYTYTNSSIIFNNVSSDGLTPFPAGHYNGNNDFQYAQEDGIKPFVNAVEIDWNNAQLGSTSINTTGELLSYVSAARTLAETANNNFSNYALANHNHETKADTVVDTFNFNQNNEELSVVTGISSTNGVITYKTTKVSVSHPAAGVSTAELNAVKTALEAKFTDYAEKTHNHAISDIGGLVDRLTEIEAKAAGVDTAEVNRIITEYLSNNSELCTDDELNAAKTELINLFNDTLKGYAEANHNHNDLYAAKEHTHDYAATNHNHNDLYAAKTHTHTLSDVTDLKDLQSTLPFDEYVSKTELNNAAYASKSYVNNQISANNSTLDTLYATKTITANSTNSGNITLNDTQESLTVVTGISQGTNGIEYTTMNLSVDCKPDHCVEKTAFETFVANVNAQIAALQTQIEQLSKYHGYVAIESLLLNSNIFTFDKTMSNSSSYMLIPSVLPTNATTQSVTWSVTEGSDILNVNNGVLTLTGNGYGQATVVATSNGKNANDNVLTATCIVTIEPLENTISYNENVTIDGSKGKVTLNNLSATSNQTVNVNYKGSNIPVTSGSATFEYNLVENEATNVNVTLSSSEYRRYQSASNTIKVTTPLVRKVSFWNTSVTPASVTHKYCVDDTKFSTLSNTITVPSEHNGNAFLGWATAEANDSVLFNDYKINPNSAINNSFAAYTYYYSEPVPVNYTISFNSNVTNAYVDGTMSSLTVVGGQPITLTPNAFTNTRRIVLNGNGGTVNNKEIEVSSAYYSTASFNGWSTTPTGEKVYNDAANVTVNADTTLYAKWNNYNAVELPTLPINVKRDSYNFVGWYTAAEGGSYIDNNYVPTNQVVTLYAHWENASVEPEPTNYYWYLGSSDDAVNDGDNPTALNTNYSGWHSVATMPIWNNILGSAIGVDAATDDYTWVIMPTEWFNKLIVKTPINSDIDWSGFNKQIMHNDVEYTAVWADVTANGLYFTLK